MGNRDTDPETSILISTCNRAVLLENCLRFLGELDFQDDELIVVNGPSNDDTRSVLRRFAEST